MRIAARRCLAYSANKAAMNFSASNACKKIKGAGAESRRQIGWVIVGGLAVGALFTIYVIPMVYTLFARNKKGSL
jgi:hypothetical protein